MDDFNVGQANPYNIPDVSSIATGRSNQWAYSPSFMHPKLIASAVVQLTGRRRQDYAAAEAATGIVHNARRTVWHHVYDYNSVSGLCTMQLVDWDVHSVTLPHAGGCVMYTEAHGGKYRVVNPNSPDERNFLQELEALEAPKCPRYSEREMNEFCLRTGLKLPPALRALYSGSRTLSRKGLRAAARQDFWLDAILPLYTLDGTASVENIALATKGRISVPSSGPATAWAVDACGDLFYIDDEDTTVIWFYDHEQDSFTETDPDLLELVDY